MQVLRSAVTERISRQFPRSRSHSPADSPIVWNAFPWSSVFHHGFSLYLCYTATWHCLALKSWWVRGSRNSFAFPNWGLYLKLGQQQSSNLHTKNNSNHWDFKKMDKKLPTCCGTSSYHYSSALNMLPSTLLQQYLESIWSGFLNLLEKQK